MKRWTISVCCTLFFLAVCCFLSLFAKEIDGGSSVRKINATESMVTLVRRARPPQTAQEQKIEPRSENVIAAPNAEIKTEETVEEKEKAEEVATVEEVETGDDEPFDGPADIDGGAEESGGDAGDAAFGEYVMSGEERRAFESYKQYALQRIAAKKLYPIRARAKGFEGKVRLHVVIEPNGALSLYEILAPSDFDELNQAALNAVKKAAPFKKMPAGSRPLELTLVMDFTLK